MSNPYSAQNLWGLQPKQVKPKIAAPIVGQPYATGAMSKAEMQTMRMKAALRSAEKPLSCVGAACLIP